MKTTDHDGLEAGDLLRLADMGGGAWVNLKSIDKYAHYCRLHRAGLIEPVRMTSEQYGEFGIEYAITPHGRARLITWNESATP